MSTERIVITPLSVFPSARVLLVLLREQDAHTVTPWVNDHEVTRTLGMTRILTHEQEREWLTNCYKEPDEFPFGIWLKGEERLIGITGLHRVDSMSGTGIFGIFIGEKNCWNKGYGTETLMQILHFAFMRKNLRKVTLTVFSSNPAGVRCYEKCGFVQVGAHKSHHYRNGEYVDQILMEVFKEAWVPIFEQMDR